MGRDIQHFAMCPFCVKVFDTTAEPFVSIIIDQHERKAHFKCVPVRQEQFIEQRKEAAE